MLRSLRLALAGVLLVAGACGGDEGPDAPSSNATDSGELIVQAANYDLAAGESSRFIAGVLTQEQLFVSFGEVDMQFFYLGTKEGEGTAQEGPTATGRFLAIEGETSQPGPIAAPASTGRGVYAADVTFDRAGFWAVQLSAEINGRRMGGRSVFEVYEKHRVAAPGDKAPFTDNRTIKSDVPATAIDSRAQDGSKVPDAELHDSTISDALGENQPVVVVFSTPVYCVSRFCGPVTDTIEDLGRKYSDVADFIHVEIWYDFQKQTVNKTAAEWLLLENGDLTEPWVFIINPDGRIKARWDNVVTRGEVERELKKL